MDSQWTIKIISSDFFLFRREYGGPSYWSDFTNVMRLVSLVTSPFILPLQKHIVLTTSHCDKRLCWWLGLREMPGLNSS